MSAHPPPIPEEQRPAHGDGRAPAEHRGPSPARTRDINTAEQGAPGNTRENTTHQGHQQDR